MARDEKWRAILLLVFATFLWGGTFSVTKMLVVDLSPLYIIAIRSLLTALMIFVLYSRAMVKEFLSGSASALLWGFSIVNFVALFFQTLGLKTTTASNTGFITAFCIVLVPILKWRHYGAKTSPFIYFAIAVAMVGVYIVSFSFALPESVNNGDAYVFICALLYGYYIVFLERLAKEFSAPFIMFFSFLITAALSFLVAIPADPAPEISLLLSRSTIVNLLLLSFFGGVIPYILMAKGQKALSAQLAALIYIFEPVFAAIIAAVWIGEKMTMSIVVGGLLIVSALILGIISERK